MSFPSGEFSERPHCHNCRGVLVTRSSTPFLVHFRQSSIGVVSTGGNGDFGFLAKKLPYPQPIGTKFGPHILGIKTHRHNFFREAKIPLTRENFNFWQIFKNSYLKNGRRFFRQIFSICRGRGSPQGAILKLGVSPQIWTWGGANFSIGPRAAPPSGGSWHYRSTRFCPCTRQWAPIEHMPAPGHYP